MKNLYSFDKFVNEGIRDMMTPLPKEEVKRKILENPELHLKRYKSYLSKEEIYDIVNKMNDGERIKSILFDVPELYSDDDKKDAIGKLSRDVRNEFVLGRFRDLYSEEEQEKAWKDIVVYSFDKAHKNGRCDVNLDWLSNKWEKYSAPYKVDNDTYQYKGKKMIIVSIPSGDWYSHDLTVID